MASGDDLSSNASTAAAAAAAPKAVSWMLEGATVEWLDDVLFVEGAVGRQLHATIEGYQPHSILHCASLVWGDLLLWPDDNDHVLDWFYQMRIASGVPFSDDEQDEDDSDREEDELAELNDRHEARSPGGHDDNDTATTTPSVPRLALPPRSPGAPTPPAKDLSPSSKELPPMPGVVATSMSTSPSPPPAAVPDDTPIPTIVVRRRPSALMLDLPAPPPGAQRLSSRRQSRFGLGAIPKTPMGASTGQRACMRARTDPRGSLARTPQNPRA